MLPGAQGLQIEFSLASKSQPLPLDPLDWIPNVVSQISQISWLHNSPRRDVGHVFEVVQLWQTLCSGSPSPSEALSLLTAAVKASVSGCLDTVEIHQGSSRNAGKMAGRLEDGRKYPYIFGIYDFLVESESLKTCILACRFDTTCGLVDLWTRWKVKENLAHLCCNSQSV